MRLFLGILIILQISVAGEPAVIVAKDGSGDFTSIQQALDAIPAGRTARTVIIVKKGRYHEKLFVSVSNVVIVGESRDSTVIEFAELRKQWLKDNPTDRGSATVNIDSGTADITIANLTIRNNYGALYGDHDHQFALWGKGTRIILLYCNVLGDGGDTVSLWNSDDGMYYHAECSFEGWVDYVCPRGWCYITDSRFYGHNLTASLWHHGSTDKDQKFVIRSSYFDGVPGFPLGRHHVDGQFYLLDCLFSRTMADSAIHYPSYSPNARPWKWGRRHYYFNCHREGGDYDWFADNLSAADGAPAPEDITPRWTFGGRWQPDSAVGHILPFIAFPFPRNGASSGAESGQMLRWVPMRNARTHLVHFGMQNDPPIIHKQQGSSFTTGPLVSGTRYYWKVDTVTGTDTVRGPLWQFTVR
jgi:pectinesterase